MPRLGQCDSRLRQVGCEGSGIDWLLDREWAGTFESVAAIRTIRDPTTTRSNLNRPIFPDRARGLTIDGPNRLWVADMAVAPIANSADIQRESESRMKADQNAVFAIGARAP